MRTAVIIGSGGFGREVAEWYVDTSTGKRILGFLDADESSHGQVRGGFRVVGGPDWLEHNAVDDVVLGMGSPPARRNTARLLAAMGIVPTTVIHPTATLGRSVTVGPGTVICPGAVLTVDIQIGSGALINLNATIGHDVSIGDFAVLAPGVDIAGNVTIGPGADIGIGASAIQGLSIGEGAVVGGGACVTRDIPSRAVAVGVPAKPIKEHDRW